MDGFFCLDKPRGPTSMDAVRLARRALGVKKMGHSGTLDPQASGLLVFAIGKATRFLNYLSLEPKTYLFDIVFGVKTNTMDETGEIIEKSGITPSLEDIESVLDSFTGEIKQIPPRFSAVKINGVRAYKLARKNKEFKISEKSVNIFDVQVKSYSKSDSSVSLSVKCSGGTYVRSLAQDIAEHLGTFGHAARIHRVSMGTFNIKQAIPLEELKNMGTDTIISMEDAFASYPSFTVSDSEIAFVEQGRDIECKLESFDAQTAFIFDTNKKFLAVAEKNDSGKYHPTRVIVRT